MADNKKYYWLKLMKDFFTKPKIKKLRKIAGGDAYTIIYLKIQLLSLEHAGVIRFEHIENTLEEEIALIIDEDVENVAVTINYLKTQGMIEQLNEEEFLLTETVLLIGSETDKAQLMRKKRANDKLNSNNVTDMLPSCYTEKEIEKDIDIELDIYSRAELDNAPLNTNKKSSLDDETKDNIAVIVEYLNQRAGTNYRTSTQNTIKHIKARLNEKYTVNDFKTVIDKKCAEWKGTQMEQYLRPATLFGTNFENYLNSKININNKATVIDNNTVEKLSPEEALRKYALANNIDF